ncbi:MAG: hypothetical protein AMS15_06210 [Planctomycetes bacterium DG_23]|nr:MAG: hypothetical protein AMS15_06210 [Planctomycetes bacterium DG_23]
MPETVVTIEGEKFFINGRPTYEGREFRGKSVEGLLFNSRMIQATFDDENPRTRSNWVYPDTKKWDPERNTEEFCQNMQGWKKCGVLGFTVNFQGGRPIVGFRLRHSPDEPGPNPEVYINSAFKRDGRVKEPFLKRMAKVLQQADELGMVAIVGYFYFSQDGLLGDEDAVIRATENATNWLLDTGHKNILVEINNECSVAHYAHAILQPPRVHELINLVKSKKKDGRRLMVSTSGGGGWLPPENIASVIDFVLVHGNAQDPGSHKDMIETIRSMPAWKRNPSPIVFNEAGTNVECLFVCAENFASWGYFDAGQNNYQDGFQSPPVNWGINTETKRRFFDAVAQITGEGGRRSQ